ncbi:unnamed protein product [Moneuplotes crassus]|uniref:Uncharacterized protein n=1 Tax=Euplotes crassus TaxID=5936 RepID=A0AAD1YCT3_EUPCR|nr:unnamed protein product [Moneuplotes crassus]
MILLKNSNVKKNANLLRRLTKLESENKTLHENLDQCQRQINDLEAVNLKNQKESNELEESRKINEASIKQYEDRCTELAEENQKLKKDNEQLLHEIEKYKHMIKEVDSHDQLQSKNLKKEKKNKIKKELIHSQNNFAKLTEEHLELQSKYSELQDKLAQAEVEPEVTVEEYNNLAIKYKELKKDENNMRNILNTMIGMKYDEEQKQNHKESEDHEQSKEPIQPEDTSQKIKDPEQPNKEDENPDICEVDMSKYELEYSSDDTRFIDEVDESPAQIISISQSVKVGHLKAQRAPKMLKAVKYPNKRKPKVPRKARKYRDKS